MRQKVALVLSSGGAKGFAHIGAIEALEEAGYEITSIAGALLIDGGVTNALPLDKPVRTPGDLLVAVNLEDYKWEGNDDEKMLFSRHPRLSRLTPMRKLQHSINVLSNNYISLNLNTISILLKRNTELALQLTPPDIYLNVDMCEFGGFDYDKALEVYKLGKEQMQQVLRADKCGSRNLSH